MLDGYECYREFMDKLAECNVDEYVNLPMIAVMGDTSSGKSSLLSNISLVDLPSSDTLTTRCPIRLQMSTAETKSARVKVVWKDIPKGDDIDFPIKTVGESNWDDITDFIAAAQAHIIKKSGREVARDVVCVDMKGPHCENLTLIDLPGIVRATGKGESSSLADDIHALMQDYLKNDRCVILAVLPSNVDYHNSQILADARKVDPGTKRTIPVLTKPDLIDTGVETSVKNLLLGQETDSFEMGFHMVKGRGQSALNEKETIEDGLAKEEAFFRNTEPWRSVDNKRLFGTKNLRVKLAEFQMKLIQSEFQVIMSEMKEGLDRAEMELKALGEIPSTLVEKRALFRSIRENMVKGIAADTLDGRVSSLSLHSNNAMRPSAEFHIASKRFRDTLHSSKFANISELRVGSKVYAIHQNKEVHDVISFIDEENGIVYLNGAVLQYNALEKQTRKTVHQDKRGNFFIKRINGTWDKLAPIKRELVPSDPRWIKDLITRNRPYMLPIFINTHVFESIIANFIDDQWSEPAFGLLQFTSKLMEAASEKFIASMNEIKALSRLRNSSPANHVKLLNPLKKNQRES
eukprot:scaffold39111_cov126-Skeletonema_marinoi.AAC.6